MTVHPTAEIERDVVIGPNTSIWDHVHIRHSTRIGAGCIIGEKSYIAYGVEIGDLVKINAFVYVCTAVTIERGVMVSAGVVFTNDRCPRATNPQLDRLLSSDPDEKTLKTLVCEGATIGAQATIGPGLRIGRFAMIGMGSVVTRDVPDFGIVAGNPAKLVAFACTCGRTLTRTTTAEGRRDLTCHACHAEYVLEGSKVTEAALV